MHEREFFIDKLLVRIHYIILMIRKTGLAPWEFEFPFASSLISTFRDPLPPPPSGPTLPLALCKAQKPALLVSGKGRVLFQVTPKRWIRFRTKSVSCRLSTRLGGRSLRKCSTLRSDTRVGVKSKGGATLFRLLPPDPPFH